MSNVYSQVLSQILLDHGRAVCDDSRRLKALLRDGLGPHPGNHDQPINVLVLALENRAAQELLAGDGVPAEMLRRRIASRLQASVGLTEQAANWAVSVWSAALAAQAAGISAPAVTPPLEVQAAAAPLPPVAASGAVVATPALAAAQTASPQAPGRLASVTQSLQGKSPLQFVRNWPLRRKLLAAGGAAVVLLGFLTGFMLTRMIGSALGRGSAPTAAAASDADKSKAGVTPEKEPAKDSWKVIFRSADPSIWNDDINKGPDHFAMALELAPDSLRYLRLTNVSAKESVIIEMSKGRLRQRSDDGRYGWDGVNVFHSGAHHLGIFHANWPLRKNGDICVCGGPHHRGWGFGNGHFSPDAQRYGWAGEPIGRTVFEIAVKSEPLTEAESKKLLKVGIPRQ